MIRTYFKFGYNAIISKTYYISIIFATIQCDNILINLINYLLFNNYCVNVSHSKTIFNTVKTNTILNEAIDTDKLFLVDFISFIFVFYCNKPKTIIVQINLCKALNNYRE